MDDQRQLQPKSVITPEFSDSDEDEHMVGLPNLFVPYLTRSPAAASLAYDLEFENPLLTTRDIFLCSPTR